MFSRNLSSLLLNASVVKFLLSLISLSRKIVKEPKLLKYSVSTVVSLCDTEVSEVRVFSVACPAEPYMNLALDNILPRVRWPVYQALHGSYRHVGCSNALVFFVVSTFLVCSICPSRSAIHL